MKKLLKNWKWYEIGFLCVSFLALIICFIFTVDKNYLSLVCSLIGVFYVMLSSKGFFWAPIVNIVYCIMYIILAFSQQYYGEVILNGCFILPLAVVATIKWLKDKNARVNNIVKVAKLPWQEYLYITIIAIIASFGIYFMLLALNTAETIVSTAVFVFSIVGTYLMYRRSSYYALAFILNNIALIILWTISVVNNGLEYLPMVISFSIFLILNSYGLIRWKLQEKNQNNQINNIEKYNKKYE